MKLNRSARWLLPLLLALACAPADAGNGVLDQIQSTFQTASTGWMTSALGLARPLFFGLAAIEFSWAAINYTLRKNDLGELLTSMTLKILGIAFFAMLLTEAPTWIPPIINSFTQAGQTVGGGGPTSISSAIGPSEILNEGINTAGNVVSTADGINNGQTAAGVSLLSPGKSIAALGSNLLSAIFIGLTGLMILLGYLAIAMQLLITTIESYIVIGAGALMLGFAGSRWTLPFAEKYFGYAVSVGIKLFTIYVVAGFGGQLANIIIAHWATVAAAAPPNNVVGPVDFMTAGVTALAYGAVGYMVPGIAGSMMNGSPSMSLSNAGAAAGGMAAAPLAAGLAGGAALSRVAALATAPFGSGGSAPKGGIGGSSLLPGGPVGGVSGTSRLESLAAGAGKAAGAGIQSASSALGAIPGAGPVSAGAGAAGKAPSAGADASGSAATAARFKPDGPAANTGATTGTGDAVKSGAELGKAAAPTTQEAGLSSAPTTASTPGGNGFASAPGGEGGASAASGAEQATAQRQFEQDNKPKDKGPSLSDRLHDGAATLQHESDKRKPGLSHDGQSGGVSIRMHHID
ncbi:putative Type IV secretory pathway TrbL components-like protein [Thiomonas sp. X19]|uniref:P-type conjugative transfer protein TrbL n=1 Tax=Thiomonas sp. X19 TaxID=1050370 RepID=UPI000B6476C9|nr:P-type conjugative transfer protein TrbL [Thiomonas sp. X19]SCC94674.1 putative Type IV secretory pathway TrbL components-like protein [Thiomonas sp. X19]